MGTMQDALRGAGVVSEKQFRETDAAAQLTAEMEAARKTKPAKEREKRLSILRQETSPDGFRREARKLLLLDPEIVQELLSIAHTQNMHHKREKGGTRLIANLYQVREAITKPDLSDEAKRDLADKLFSKR